MNIVKSKSFKNGTVYCLRLEDGMLVETTDTFLPYYTKDAIGRKQNFLDNDNLGSRSERWMIGVSTMSGCPVRCKFCATGNMKRYRNLTADEIVGQVEFAIEQAGFDPCDANEFKINYTRMGEPFLNIEAVKEARAQGDLSENFEYHAAKKDKNQNESRIRYLEKMIKTAKIISTDSAEDEVGMNNTVTVYFEEDDEEEVYKIVTTVRGNSLKNLISNESPLGKALLGHRVGDRVEVRVNDDYSYFVTIRKIENTVDDGTDKLRKF